MSSNRHALIVMGALLHGPLLAELVETARSDGSQVVFVGASDSVTPRFPDWVIDAREELFHGTNLAAQLRAVGIARLSIAGPESAILAARNLGFEAETAQAYA